jgi:hypothetical protein
MRLVREGRVYDHSHVLDEHVPVFPRALPARPSRRVEQVQSLRKRGTSPESKREGHTMNTQTLSETEIETLRKGATGAGLLVAVSDKSFFDSFKEAGALAKHLAEAQRSSQSPLIRQVAEGHGTGFGLTTSPEEVESETLEALRSATQLLEARAPEELDAYRSFVVEIARSVSAAAGGGDEAEAATIEKINEALAAAS